MISDNEPLAWEPSKCRVPMWMGGGPSGHCGRAAYGHQYPKSYLWQKRSVDRAPYCFGHCCPDHGGPNEGEPIIFEDGYTEQGRSMYCAVMPDFINLQESPAGFSGNPLGAVKNLQEAIAKATGEA